MGPITTDLCLDYVLPDSMPWLASHEAQHKEPSRQFGHHQAVSGQRGVHSRSDVLGSEVERVWESNPYFLLRMRLDGAWRCLKCRAAYNS